LRWCEPTRHAIEPEACGDNQEQRVNRSTRALVFIVLSVGALWGCTTQTPNPDTRERVTESDQTEADRRARVRMELASGYYARGQFETALDARHARVKGMSRRMVDMLAYLMQHDAHHRGQICTLAYDLGHKFGVDDLMRFWGWKRIGAAPNRGAPRRRAAG